MNVASFSKENTGSEVDAVYSELIASSLILKDGDKDPFTFNFAHGALIGAGGICEVDGKSVGFRDAQFLDKEGKGETKIYLSSLMLIGEEKINFEKAIDKIGEKLLGDFFGVSLDWESCSRKVVNRYSDYELARDATAAETDPVKNANLSNDNLQAIA